MTWQANSDDYLDLRRFLVDHQKEIERVEAKLDSLPDRGAGWMLAAQAELRRAMARGRVSDGLLVGDLIRCVLEVRGERSACKIHAESIRWLMRGISAVLDRDVSGGVALLEQVTVIQREQPATDTGKRSGAVDASLVWIAWFWMCKARCEGGDLIVAAKDGAHALTIAEQLDDDLALSSTLCLVAEVDFLRGQLDDALDHLTRASALYDKLDDRGGKATVLLTRARMEAASGKIERSLASATEARQLKPDWPEPVLFLAQQSMIASDFEQAAWVLELFYNVTPRPPEISRELGLLKLVNEGEVAPEVMSIYVELRGLPASDETIRRLHDLVKQAPSFLRLRELLAWTQLRRGYQASAKAQFDFLAEQELDSDLLSSVLLGLGCLASRRDPDKHFSARARAAATAGVRADRRLERGPVEQLSSVVDVESMETLASVTPRVDSSSPSGAGGDDADGEGEPAIEPLDNEELAVGEFDAGVDRTVAGIGERSLTAIKAKAASNTAFSGELELFGFSDLLEFLTVSRRTGTLVITSTAGVAALHLEQGLLACAASPESPSIGKLLIGGGFVTEQRLVEVARSDAARGRLLGSVLVEQGDVTATQVKRALGDQIHFAVGELLTWPSGRFAFEPGERSEPSSIEIRLDTRGVLLEAARKLDESRA